MRRTRPHLVLAVATLAALTVLVAACGGSTSGSGGGSSAAASAAPVKGGTLVATYQGEPQGLDPAIDWEGQGWAIEHTMFNNFIKYASRGRHGRHGDAARPRHGAAHHRERRHQRGRHRLHLPPQEGHQVRAAGGP